MIRRIGLVVALTFLLVACSVTPERWAEDYRLSSMQYLQQERNWSFEGRLAVVNEKDSISASIVWRHMQNSDDIELVGPLGQGRVKINVSPELVLVDDGENRKMFYGPADEVIAEQLGVAMPVNALKYWVLGVNDPEQDFTEQVGGFYQGGWLVRYREMQKVSKESLPRKMTVEKDKTRIKLIIDQWDLS